MRKKIAMGLMGLGFGWSILAADVSEMIFYPEADFSEGIFHFNYQGDKNKNYSFMFEKGFDTDRIVYVRPADYRIEKLRNGNVKVSFNDTDRYVYMQRAYRDDFLVSDESGIVKILLSGGDCSGSDDCLIDENVLTINVPKGYTVRSYQGLDQDLKPLKNPKWQRKGNTFTLTAHNVKGACIMMDLQRLKQGEASVQSLLPPPVLEKPSAPKAVPAARKQVVSQSFFGAAPVALTSDFRPDVAGEPAPYFRNFQLFETRSVIALNAEGKARLDQWAEQFKSGGYRSVQINAYTDDIPPQRLKNLYATNEILSEARGKAVADYLVSVGIDESRITVKGRGPESPVASNETEAGRSKNRRIEFILSR